MQSTVSNTQTGFCFVTQTPVIFYFDFPFVLPCVFRIRKILHLRLFADENGRAWSKSVMDLDYEVLCVSQFTLQCVLKGNKPDFHLAMPAELAQPFYNSILENMRSVYKPELIKGGRNFPLLSNVQPAEEVSYGEGSAHRKSQHSDGPFSYTKASLLSSNAPL